MSQFQNLGDEAETEKESEKEKEKEKEKLGTLHFSLGTSSIQYTVLFQMLVTFLGYFLD